MTQIRNLFFLFSITIFGIASTVLTIFNYSPYESGQSVFVNFFCSFGISIAGIVAIAIYFIRTRAKKAETVNHLFWPSVRQGFFFGILISTLLFLQSLRILDWMIGISITIVIVLLELFFQTKKVKTKS